MAVELISTPIGLPVLVASMAEPAWSALVIGLMGKFVIAIYVPIDPVDGVTKFSLINPTLPIV